MFLGSYLKKLADLQKIYYIFSKLRKIETNEAHWASFGPQSCGVPQIDTTE